MKTSSLLPTFFYLVTVLLTSCAPRPIEITSFPSKLTINDINIEFSGYKIDDGYDLTIDICFPPPSEEIWLFDDVTLKIDDKEIAQEVAMQYVTTETETGRTDGYDCGRVMYAFEWSKVPTGKAELSIGKIRTHVDIEDQDCNVAQKHLDEAKTGIVISCDPAIVGHDFGFIVLKKPFSMSDDEAIFTVMDSFSESVTVNWKFSFDIERP